MMEVELNYEPSGKHRILFSENFVFADIDGRVRMIRIKKEPVPAFYIRDLTKVPAGFISFREIAFFPEQFEEHKKLIHPLLLIEIPVEMGALGETVLARYNVVDEKIIPIKEIKIENNMLILVRGYKSEIREEEFLLKEINGFYVVEKYGEYKLRSYKTSVPKFPRKNLL